MNAESQYGGADQGGEEQGRQQWTSTGKKQGSLGGRTAGEETRFLTPLRSTRKDL